MSNLQNHESRPSLVNRYLNAFGFGLRKTPAKIQNTDRQSEGSLLANLQQQAQLALAAAETAKLAKSNFLSAMSHELRTPINAIVGFCEILTAPQSETLSVESRKNYLNTIVENAQQLQNMINDILDVSRFERGSFQLVEQNSDAAEIIEAAIKLCREQAERASISIVAHLIEDVTVRGDLVRLKQVVQNLLTNAIKFSPQDTVVNVNMQKGDNGGFRLLVRDVGIGISDEDAMRAFDSFVQMEEGATRSYAGIGLGLSIARRIARLHGGEVSLSGKMGAGTEALLVLPASRIVWSDVGLQTQEKVAA